MKPHVNLLLLLSFGLSAPVGAEIYRWVGADGKPHFSDKPPVGAVGVGVFHGGAAVSFRDGVKYI